MEPTVVTAFQLMLAAMMLDAALPHDKDIEVGVMIVHAIEPDVSKVSVGKVILKDFTVWFKSVLVGLIVKVRSEVTPPSTTVDTIDPKTSRVNLSYKRRQVLQASTTRRLTVDSLTD